VDNLRAALREEPLDRQKTNALLRQLFSGVTVDYGRGVLRLQWAHDGETEVIYDWGKALPEDAAE